MTYVIAQPCVDVKDKACIEECPVDCIYIDKEKSPVGQGVRGARDGPVALKEHLQPILGGPQRALAVDVQERVHPLVDRRDPVVAQEAVALVRDYHAAINAAAAEARKIMDPANDTRGTPDGGQGGRAA